MNHEERQAFLDRVNRPRQPRSERARRESATAVAPPGMEDRVPVIMHGEGLTIKQRQRAAIIEHQERNRDDTAFPLWVNG